MLGQVDQLNVNANEIQIAVDQAKHLLQLYQQPTRTQKELREVYNSLLNLLGRMKKGKQMMDEFEVIYRQNPSSKNNKDTMSQIFDLYCLLQSLLGLYLEFYREVMEPKDYQNIMLLVMKKWQEEGDVLHGEEREKAI